MKRPHSRQAPHRSPPFWTLHLCKIVLAERIGQRHDIEDDGDDCVSHEYGVLQFPIAVEQQRHKHNSEDALRNVAKDEGADSDEQGDDCHSKKQFGIEPALAIGRDCWNSAESTTHLKLISNSKTSECEANRIRLILCGEFNLMSRNLGLSRRLFTAYHFHESHFAPTTACCC